MIQRDRGNRASRRPRNDIRGIATPAQPHLEDAQLRWHLREQMKRHGGDHLEHGNRGTVIHPFDMFQRIPQRHVRNQLPGDTDALVETH